GDLDYVCCWYKKAIDYIRGSFIRCALVSTNSITQGGSVSNLWKPLFASGVHIDFAHRTFRWDSEASLMAHVHCVIIGFSTSPYQKDLLIFDGAQKKKAKNINGYLIDAENIYIDSKNKPICDVPAIAMGNQPIDDGNYLFTETEMRAFIANEPGSAKWFMPWYGAQEFINRSPRYCLWLGKCSPTELRKMPNCLKRIEAVRSYRQQSQRASTNKMADKPTRFQTENMPRGHYICIPEVSSEKRRYVPMGYMDDTVLCSNKLRLMPNADLYHFGVLQSNVHNSWVRAVCGRLETRLDYSIKIVYNNFPWPTPTDAQKAKIEQTAQGILDARALYPDSSLADLYDELTMPPELRTAHQRNDRAVMEAYGMSIKDTTESTCVAELMRMYQKLTQKQP
ncbi:MAG: class I SAM-dependent DNA methyltransferase, partial [Clostridia bacterium]|nr:class I SAM-dependent DNA methyltransferase [Clostridia bacterium]